MDKSLLFKQAHQLTKKVIKKGDNYQVTFGLCLKEIKAKNNQVKKIQYNKGQIVVSNSHYNGISTYTESYYYSVKPFIITLLFVLAIITSQLSIIK